MAVSRLTAIIIQSRPDDIKTGATMDEKSGKWSGTIILYEDGNFDRQMVSSRPIYPSSDAAIASMDSVVAEIHKMDPLEGATQKESIDG